MSAMKWTHEQFSDMSWHDNHVHGLRVVEGSHGTGELILDLDYILEWLCEMDGTKFKIVPVNLTFLEVCDLRVSLDYATPTAALSPFSIHSIERFSESRGHYVAEMWKIAINWPKGEITFQAKGYEQRAIGAVVVSGSQCLLPAERNHIL